MKLITNIFVIIFSIIMLFSAKSYAQDSQSYDSQFKEISQNLRCVVCNNQSVYESDSPIAINIRKFIKLRLSQCQSPKLIKDYLHKRYGDVILLTPPFNKNTFVFWLIVSTILVLLFSIIVVVLFMSRKNNSNDNNIVSVNANNDSNDSNDINDRLISISHKKVIFMLSAIIAIPFILFTVIFIKLHAYDYYNSINSFNLNINKIDEHDHLTKSFCEDPNMELTAILMGERNKINILLNKCLKDYPRSEYLNNLKNTIR